MTGLTDLHQHVLWGVDDGPRKPEAMYRMLRLADEQGIRRVAATPHACPGFRPFDMGLYRERLSEARTYCGASGLKVQVMTGAEVAWTYQTVDALRRGQLPTLNGSDCVLLELWHDISWDETRSAVTKLLRSGFLPVLAHVERYRCFVWQPGRAVALKREMPVCYQVNASTVLGACGYMQRRFVRYMLDREFIDVIASDAHDCESRPARMAEAFRALGTRCESDYLERMFNFDGVLK